MGKSLNNFISVTVLASAALVGFILSPIPANIGLYRWIGRFFPFFIGVCPIFHQGIPWQYSFDDLYNSDLTGQTALVTGANSGIGYETALALGRVGASVTLACRNQMKCEQAASDIRADSRYGGGDIFTMIVDTSSLKSVQNFSREYVTKHQGGTLDLLFLNAGIAASSTFLSEDGIEMTFATNFVGHHLMFKYLEPLILKSDLARVVTTASCMSFLPSKIATSVESVNSLSKDLRYSHSKLAQILWVKELTTRLSKDPKAKNVYVNAAHPGGVDTGIWLKNPEIPLIIQNSLLKWIRSNVFWTAEEGALTMLYLGVATDQLVAKDIRGKYYHPQAQEVVNPLAMDENLQREMWIFADQLVSSFLD